MISLPHLNLLCSADGVKSRGLLDQLARAARDGLGPLAATLATRGLSSRRDGGRRFVWGLAAAAASLALVMMMPSPARAALGATDLAAMQAISTAW